MALTLPYPSMNFVPLDVLTAAEQNQLVANIQYIANQFPIKFKAGDTYTILQTMTGQVRNLNNSSQNDIAYFTVTLPFEVDTGVRVSLNSFRIAEIENIGYVSTSSIVSVKDSNNQNVTLDQSHMTATASFDDSSRRSLILGFKLKTGYHWDGATSYNVVQFRTAQMTFTFD